MLSAFTYVPILAREQLSVPEILVTVIVGGFASASFVSSYIFGRAGDIYGRRVVIRLGLLLSTLTFGLLLFSTSLPFALPLPYMKPQGRLFRSLGFLLKHSSEMHPSMWQSFFVIAVLPQSGPYGRYSYST